jgi:predicted nucleic acid-binding Zn ribbon protein
VVVLDVDSDFIFRIVIYFELRFMRTRNKEYMNRMMDKDDAYNCIATTKAICTTLRQKGRDTREAEPIIIQAEQAYKRGNFIHSRELAKRARDILINAPSIEMAPAKVESTEESSEVSVPEEERKTLHEVKKMEPHMMESRFIINSCRDRLKDQQGSGKDLSKAQEHLDQAERCFQEERYGDALREGLKARRMLTDSTIEGEQKVEEGPLIKVPKPERVCPQCGTKLGPDDQFCRKCGFKVETTRTCPHCQAPLEADDVFCPKCGRRI